MPGVNIIEKRTTNGVVTDFDDAYTISVKDNTTLVFSYVSFDTQEVKITGRSTINVTLKDNLQSLDEVVVIWLWNSEKRRCKLCYFFSESKRFGKLASSSN